MSDICAALWPLVIISHYKDCWQPPHYAVVLVVSWHVKRPQQIYMSSLFVLTFPKGGMVRLRDLLSSLYIQSTPINLINETYIPKLEGKNSAGANKDFLGGKKGAKETLSPLNLCCPPHSTPEMLGEHPREHICSRVGPPTHPFQLSP